MSSCMTGTRLKIMTNGGRGIGGKGRGRQRLNQGKERGLKGK